MTNTPARDEVDGIVEAWRHILPDIDPSPMAVFSRVSRLARRFDLYRRKAFLAQNLEPWEFDVLSVLRRAGYPYSLTPGALLTELLVSSGTMTNRIDRLEAKGLVHRAPSREDRRAIQVILTPDGVEAVDGALEELVRVEREFLAPLSEDDRKHLVDLLRIVLAPLDAAATK